MGTNNVELSNSVLINFLYKLKASGLKIVFESYWINQQSSDVTFLTSLSALG